MDLNNHQHTARLGVDALAGVTAFGSGVGLFFGWLSPVLASIASLMSIIWLGIQIKEYLRRKKDGRK